MPAATQAATSSQNPSKLVSRLPHELLTTSGAAAGSPPGASIHWKPSWTSDSVPTPLSLRILAAIHSASGATPVISPPGGEPRIVPVTWVPWPLPSPGSG